MTRKSSWVGSVYAVVFIIALLTCAAGVVKALDGDFTLLAAGAVSLVVVLSTWPLATLLNAPAPASSDAAMSSELMPLLRRIADQLLLSDRAKAVAYRANEREALRKAIQEDLAKNDYGAALVLADQMDNVFGYKDEAERVRGEINAVQDSALRNRIDNARQSIDNLCSAEQWAAADREAEALFREFPQLPEVQSLNGEITQRKLRQKDNLIQQYQDSVAKHDTDGSIVLLRRLDIYLTPSEAENLQDSARGVFKDKLLALRQQFTDCVAKHRWREAIDVGEQIVADFPNTQMAHEVRDRMETLHQKAAENHTAQA